jgi:hypothetical protein
MVCMKRLQSMRERNPCQGSTGRRYVAGQALRVEDQALGGVGDGFWWMDL